MEIINDISRHFVITAVAFFFFTKIRPLNLIIVKNALLCVGFIVLSTSAFALFTNLLNIAEPLRTVIVIIASGTIFALILRERIEKMITGLIIVFAVSIILYFISLTASYLITSPFLSTDASDDFWRVVIASAICIVAAVLLGKIKFDFTSVFKKFANGIFLSISGIVIIFYGVFTEDISDESTRLLFFGFIVLGYGIFSWLRRETTISKNENAHEVIDKKRQEIIEQKEKDMTVLKDMHDYLASVVHRDDKKLGAMQRAVEKLIMRSQQWDVLEDAKNILDEISISREKDERDYNNKVLGGKTLPLTDLQIVDAKFETLAEKAMLKSVDFGLEVNGNASGFGSIILEYELSNIIGDLAENAFIAVQSQDQSKIQFSIGKSDTGYELSVSDSGIPFDTDILFKLGTERVTSRPNDGGSGYGYETIFGLLDEYGASLIITEYEPVSDDYSKNITIRFDGKADYIIKSFRADALRKQNADTKFTIHNLEDKALYQQT